MFSKKYLFNFCLSFYHWLLAWLAAVIYRFPSRHLAVIGITGTNGKTTTVLMASRILEEAGFKVGSVSSLWYKIGEYEKPNPLHMTMPGRFRLQKLLQQMVKAGCQYAVLEVTSEGIKQHRHCGINFDVAVLTNLSPEHIEAHGSFEKYRATKAKLFFGLVRSRRKNVAGRQIAKTTIVNLGDKNAPYFLRYKADKKYGFRINKKNNIIARSPRFIRRRRGNLAVGNKNFCSLPEVIQVEKLDIENDSSQFSIFHSSFSLPLPGQFNINNALAAICVGLSQGVPLEQAQSVLAKIDRVPGRMEFIQREPFSVIIDLAHTPPAAEAIYQACQKMLAAGAKIITVFGAAGGLRDHWKRPRLGELAARYCDRIILTNEDPYDENPQKIIDDIERGIKDKNKVLKILDRRQAINKSLQLAQPGDIVLILGKGTEPTMVFADGKKIPWDDRQVAREELAKL